MELIDKDALVAEIERRIKEIEEIGTYLSPKGTLTNLLCYINAIEVKEVDLEKEMDAYWDKYCNDEFGELVERSNESFDNIAKHFFELGLKSKGE